MVIAPSEFPTIITFFPSCIPRHGTSNMKQNAFALLRRAAQYSRPRPNLCKSAPCAIRWSSSGERQWSTPLAKSLAEAITVHISHTKSDKQRITLIDDWAYLCRFIHAPMPYLPGWRILHATDDRSRPVRREGRFHHVSRNQPGIRRVSRYMAICGMAGARTEREGTDN